MLLDVFKYVLDEVPHSAPLNMAIDEELLKTATGPLLRVYQWERPAVSFGYFGKWNEVRAEWPDRELVRRWTGGGVVPHGTDYTYTLIVPKPHPFAALPAGESYRRVHQVIASVLARTTAAAPQLASAAAPKISNACFANPAQFDILQGEEKLAGAAQRRTQFGLLHQGSIQMADLPEAFAVDFPASLAEEFGSKLERISLSPAALENAEATSRAKYATTPWMERF